MSPLSASAASSYAAATLSTIAARSVESDFDTFKDSFSSWDSCMSKAYCKWPVIAAIIVGSLIVLSIIICISRCLCCGVECCCGWLACCNACCPSPRGGSNKTTYVQAPQQQQPWPQQPYWQPNMAYGPPATATFDAPSNKNAASRAMMVGNNDALPEMPSWQTAQSRRIEEEVEDENPVEETALGETGEHAIPMGAVTSSAAAGRPVNAYPSAGVADDEEQRLPMLSQQQPQGYRAPSPMRPQAHQQNSYGYGNTSHVSRFSEDTSYAATRSPVSAYAPSAPYDAQPQQHYSGYQQQVPPQQSQQNAAPFSPYDYHPSTNPNSRTNAHVNEYNNDYSYNSSSNPAHISYASTAAPSYHSRAPTAAPTSPIYDNTISTAYGGNNYSWGEEDRGFARKPVQRSYRDV